MSQITHDYIVTTSYTWSDNAAYTTEEKEHRVVAFSAQDAVYQVILKLEHNRPGVKAINVKPFTIFYG